MSVRNKSEFILTLPLTKQHIGAFWAIVICFLGMELMPSFRYVSDSNEESEVKKAWDQIPEMSNGITKGVSQMRQYQSLLYRDLASQKYGAGPHYAEFEVLIQSPGAREGETKRFTIEFAPLDIMPVTVFMIMQQIELGLWDDTSFRMDAPHVMMAQPFSSDGSKETMTSMLEMGLARLPFAEYSEHFPHDSFTLGLSGRVLPGPNFFVNKIDNTENHAGQPCFAKVIAGHSTFDAVSHAMGSGSGSDSDDLYYTEPVTIKAVRLHRPSNSVQKQQSTNATNSYCSELVEAQEPIVCRGNTSLIVGNTSLIVAM